MSESPEENDTDVGSTESADNAENIDEQGRNPTQQRMDEEGTEPVPVDEEWDEQTDVGSTESSK